MTDHYYYKTRVGTFWIKPQSGSPGRFLLGIDDSVIDSYASARMAADDIYMHATGWDDWDSLDGSVDGPTDLSDWHRGIPDL